MPDAALRVQARGEVEHASKLHISFRARDFFGFTAMSIANPNWRAVQEKRRGYEYSCVTSDGGCARLEWAMDDMDLACFIKTRNLLSRPTRCGNNPKL